MRRITTVAAAVLALAAPLEAYYHYVHYSSRNAPFVPIYEKFDLTKLPNKTVTFFVSDQGPSVYAANDSFGSVLSQIKQAAAAWNSVTTSDLRVAFGGLESYTANPTTTATGSQALPSTTPGGDVIFVDLPGVVGLGAPTTSTTAATAADGTTFFPILRGIVMLSRDTTSTLGPSYYENFYNTAIHEIGHSLGLQHTWTSSAMSQGVVRNTSRARPLDADDRAAISMLYGTANWKANFGSITGKVTYTNGQPVSLASVVAIAPAGSAVSALTNPDGTYEIDGIPATSNYLVYVHPLPPDALNPDESGIRFPKDPNGQTFAPSTSFQTVFYPGTLDPTQATVIPVGAGVQAAGVNFTVQTRVGVPAYDVVTYCRLNTATRTYIWSGDKTVPSTTGGGLAYIDSTLSQYGTVILQSQPPLTTPVPQGAMLLGGLGSAISIQQYTDGSGAVVLYFQPLVGVGLGPRHLVLNFGNDIFVQPDAVTLVQQGPPVINSVIANSDGTVTVSGAGLAADSNVFFDGLQARVVGPLSGTAAAGSITVQPPPAASGQTSTLTIYNSDSQNSMIIQGAGPATYTYPAAATPQISGISQPSLPAGSTAAVDVTLPNASLVDGLVTVGFGSNDVTVRRVWVLSPTHLVANVVVAPGAAIGASEVSVISGLQIVSQPYSFQTQVAQTSLPVIGLPVVNGDPNQQTIYPGGVATIYGQNLMLSSVPQLTLNDQAVPILYASAGQINFLVPAAMPVGPAYLKLNNGTQSAYPVVVQIDNLPPVIIGITNLSNVSLLSLGASSGDLINVTVAGLDTTVFSNLSRLQVTVGGVGMPVVGVNALGGGLYQVQIVLKQSFDGNQVPVQVWVDGSGSAAVLLTVR